jgi:hypothetical protein
METTGMVKCYRQLALALFDDEPAAREALAALQQWDEAPEDLKLGHAGLLAKDGALAGPFGWGAVILSSLAGRVITQVMPSAGDGMTLASQGDIEHLIQMLDEGKVVVAVMVRSGEAGAVMDKLRELRSTLTPR